MKLKSPPSAGKVMLIAFWDSQGPNLKHYPEKGSTVNSEHYSDMLLNKLKPAIFNKRVGLCPSTYHSPHHSNSSDNSF